VAESVPIPTATAPDRPLPTTKSSGETKRRLLAALFSALVPGAEQFFLGQRQKAAYLLLIFTALLIGFWPFRFLRFYAGFLLLYCSWIALYLYAACSAQQTRDPQRALRPSKFWLIAIVPLTLLTLTLSGILVTRASGFRSFTIPSPSMEKTVLKGDKIVADMRYYRSRPPDRGTVIIFKRDGTFYIKRVIAISGDTIEGRYGQVLVNGLLVDEPYVEHTSPIPDPRTTKFGPIRILDGYYFVMGDNRDVSLDSRWPSFGLVSKDSIAGKPLYVIGSDRPGKHIP
jgi:signal peptidase I